VNAATLVQETGDHAVLQSAPSAWQGQASNWVVVSRDGQPDQRIDYATFFVKLIYEADRDEDGVGDETEDRTDLRVSTATAREPDGRARLEITLTNAGPLTAGIPDAVMTGYDAWRWDTVCNPTSMFTDCRFIKPGQSVVMVAHSDTRGAVAGDISVSAQGPDLAPSDNRATYALAAVPPATAVSPPLSLTATGSQHLRKGIALRVSAGQAGRVRLTLAITRSGRTIKLDRVLHLTATTPRAVTIHLAGAKLRALRRMLAKGQLSAKLTVRTIDGKQSATTRIRVTR
jgi:hypothetical protein